jgi:hypothetical protein
MRANVGGGLAQRRYVRVELLPILAGQVLRRDVERLVGLDIFQQHGLTPVRLQLARIEQLEQHDVVAVIGERLDGLAQLQRVAIEIGDHRDQAATLQMLAEAAEAFFQVRAATGGHGIDRMDHALQTARAAGGRAVLTDLLIEHDQADGVVLPGREIRERGSEELAVLQFAHAAGAVIHRRAGVEQDHQPRVGLAFVAADVSALGARVHIPVDEARVVAFDVRAVFLELLAEAVVRRTMQTGEKALDRQARHQLEVREPRERRRWQQAIEGPLINMGTHLLTTSFSTSSTLLPSDSA